MCLPVGRFEYNTHFYSVAHFEQVLINKVLALFETALVVVQCSCLLNLLSSSS